MKTRLFLLFFRRIADQPSTGPSPVHNRVLRPVALEDMDFGITLCCCLQPESSSTTLAMDGMTAGHCTTTG
jgi:hypothetical protein